MSPSQPELSNALRITNVNDFLTPAANCVLPLGGGAIPAGSVLAPIIPTTPAAPATGPGPPNPVETKTSVPSSGATEPAPTVATVTVSDCLSCSGCVTSADTVLLSSASLDTLRAFAAARQGAQSSSHFAVAVLSQQSIASLAAACNLGLTTTARRVATFFRDTLHFDAVVDASFAHHFALLAAAREFVTRHRSRETADAASTAASLTITSACPGWLTYAEKTQPPAVLSTLSSVRSPQAIAGAFAAQLRPPGEDRPVWVLSVAPCHDRKLEATRPELGNQVECVITTTELRDLLDEREVKLADTRETALTTSWLPSSHRQHENDADGRNGNDASEKFPFGVSVGSGSGGYADFVLRFAARELLNVELPPDTPLTFEKASRSGDLRVATVSDAGGTQTLRFATAYGFRSLQSVLRRVRAGQCQYDYIELMACPGGCNNGGGQIARVDDPADTRRLKEREAEFLGAVEAKFFDAPRAPLDPLTAPGVKDLTKLLFDGQPWGERAREQLSLRIESRQQKTAITPASLEW